MGSSSEAGHMPDGPVTTRPLRHSILYTKDGELDFGWLILVACCVVGLGVFVGDALRILRPSVAAWAWFGSFTAMAFIAGATISRARLIAKSNVPGEVAQGIAQSAMGAWGVRTEPYDDPSI